MLPQHDVSPAFTFSCCGWYAFENDLDLGGVADVELEGICGGGLAGGVGLSGERRVLRLFLLGFLRRVVSAGLLQPFRLIIKRVIFEGIRV